MNTKTIYATQKNLKPVKPNLLYEKLDKHIGSNKLNFSNSGGLRKKNYYKSSIKDKPLISIITVSFNSEKTIEKTIISVLQQNYENIEYIVIDGNSKDGTLDIIKKYEGSIDLWVSENDEGIFNAINKGISNCSGDIIGILNSDDYFYEDALQIVKSYFETMPNIDFLFGSVNKHIIKHGFYPNKIFWTFEFYTAHSLGFFIKSSSQKKIGYYNIKYKYSADYDLFYRMIVKLKMIGTSTKKNEIMGFFNPHGLSSRLRYIDYLNENTRIRLDNGQNKIIVWIIHFLRLSKRIFRVIKEIKK